MKRVISNYQDAIHMDTFLLEHFRCENAPTEEGKPTLHYIYRDWETKEIVAETYLTYSESRAEVHLYTSG